MNLKPIESILSHNLAPWKPENKIMDRFKVMLQKLPDKSYNTFYEVEYLAQTNEKHTFYFRTIKNTVYDYLEDFSKSFNTASNADHKEYLFLKAIKSILQYFKDTQELIEERDYNVKDINNPKNRDIRDDIYIIHLIKNYLIALYLEIKEVTQDQVTYAFLDEASIQAEFFQTYDYKSCINEVPEPLKQELQSEQFKKSIKSKFTPQPFDFRGLNPDVLIFEEIVINADRFSDFEIKLFENKYIDENYFFIKDRKTNNSENFELIALAMIEKGLFRKTKLGKTIKDTEYRKFINHRYKSNVDKKFRIFRDNKVKIAYFIETNIWLRNFPKY